MLPFPTTLEMMIYLKDLSAPGPSNGVTQHPAAQAAFTNVAMLRWLFMVKVSLPVAEVWVLLPLPL